MFQTNQPAMSFPPFLAISRHRLLRPFIFSRLEFHPGGRGSGPKALQRSLWITKTDISCSLSLVPMKIIHPLYVTT